MRRSLRLLVLPSVVLLGAISGQARADDTLEGWIEAQIRLEEELLERTRLALRTARQQRLRSQDGVRDLESRLDRELEAARPSLAQVQALQADLAESRALNAARAETLDRLAQEMLDRLSRLEVLRGLRTPNTREADDPLSGRWNVRVLPQGLTGTMELHLEGTIVSGTYSLDGGFQGSLRGIFVRRHLTLERIDAEEGFDVVYEADLDTAGDTLRGPWRATLLNRPGPAGGDWIGERVRPTDEEQKEP